MTLSTKAMLVSVNISQWTARKFDKAVTAEVSASKGAAADAGRYNKALIGKDEIKPVQKAANAVRTFHVEQTLPWFDKGARILPAGNYIDYTQGMRPLKADFEKSVSTFLVNYPDYFEAAKVRLNGMFDAFDYPTPDEILKRFHCSIRVFNLPDHADFRVTLADGEVASIRAQIERDVHGAFEAANKHLFYRVQETVSHLAKSLRSFGEEIDGTEKTKTFRDSLIGNVEALVDLLPKLNVTDNADLADIAARLKREVCGHSAKHLRENTGTRENVARNAEKILSDMAGYVN
jgi:hypothetical protein